MISNVKDIFLCVALYWKVPSSGHTDGQVASASDIS